MNQNEKNLFKYCKNGDLSKIKQLVEKEEIQLNLRDKWDSTPLYYACLCGHLEVVEFLLENGARCEANTFDGERCLYGALTDKIRSVLKNFKINVSKLDQYYLHLERLFELGSYSDITFEIKDRMFKAHKFILAARSEYFRYKFENKWKKRSWIIGEHEELVPEAFESILKYIYTGRFTTLKTYFKYCVRLAKLFKLTDLIEKFKKEIFELETVDNELKLNEFDINNNNYEEQNLVHGTDIFIIGKFGLNSKLSSSISILSQDKIRHDFKKLVFFCLPECLRHDFKLEHDKTINFSKTIDCTHDLTIILEENLKFNLHKAFIAERCEYFKAFLNDPFHEVQNSNEKMSNLKQVANISLKEIPKDVFVEIISYLYSDEFSKEKLDDDLVYEVLLVADLYLLPSLKRKCASELANYVNKENVFDFLKISRSFDLKKLEFLCVNFLAQNLFEFETSQELRELVVEDAKSLKHRQETDTIDIIDDIRYAINESTSNITGLKSLSNTDFIMEREYKLSLLDKILHELNLVC